MADDYSDENASIIAAIGSLDQESIFYEFLDPRKAKFKLLATAAELVKRETAVAMREEAIMKKEEMLMKASAALYLKIQRMNSVAEWVKDDFSVPKNDLRSWNHV